MIALASSAALASEKSINTTARGARNRSRETIGFALSARDTQPEGQAAAHNARSPEDGSAAARALIDRPVLPATGSSEVIERTLREAAARRDAGARWGGP